MQRFWQAAAMVSRRDDADGLSARTSPASWDDMRLGEVPQQVSIVAARAHAASGKAKGKAVKLLFARGPAWRSSVGMTAEQRKVSFRLQLRT